MLLAASLPKKDAARFLLFYFLWGETESTWYCGHYWPTVPAPDDREVFIEQLVE
jgi:hypothetical protein